VRSALFNRILPQNRGRAKEYVLPNSWGAFNISRARVESRGLLISAFGSGVRRGRRAGDRNFDLANELYLLLVQLVKEPGLAHIE